MKKIDCKIIFILLLLLWVLFIPNALSLVQEKNLKMLTEEADNIVIGKVGNQESYWEDGKIFTNVTIFAKQHLKGKNEKQITLTVPGGTVDGISATVSDAPLFEEDDEVLLFLKENNLKHDFIVLGWNQGKYTIKNNKIKENGAELSEFIKQIRANVTTIEKGKTEQIIEVAQAKLNPTAIISLPENESKPVKESKQGIISQPLNVGDWTTIKTEGFEGVFPGSWTLYGNPTWCDTNYRYYSGYWSGWNACGGSNRVQPGGQYPNNMNSWMVYGPFDLSDASDAIVTFQHWTRTESNYDFFYYMASTDGWNFYGNRLSGDWSPWWDLSPWNAVTFDLKNVYVLGDLRGKNKVWIAFLFTSDGSVTDLGTFIDDIDIKKQKSAPATPSITSITPNFGHAKAAQLGSTDAASDSTRVTIAGSNFGSTSWNVIFSSGDSVLRHAAIESWGNTQITARVPGGASSGDVYVYRSDGVASNKVNFGVTYSYGGGKWPGNTVTYYVNPNTADTAGELEAVQAAARTWSNIGANFEYIYGGASSKQSIGYDGENTVVWNNKGNTGTIATTWTYWYNNNPTTIIENDLEFNDYYNWDTSGSPSSSQMDVQTIATHEFGHWLQLLDLYGTNDNGKMMYGWGSLGTVKRNLHQNDLEGIKAIYGIRNNPNTPVLFTPADNSVLTTLTPIFDWNDFGDPNPGDYQTAFQIRVWENSGPNTDGTKIVLDKEYTSSSSQVTPPSSDYINGGLVGGRNYHWHVRVKDSSGLWSYWAADTRGAHMDFRTNSPPNQPTSLAQYKSDGVTGISWGGTTSESTVVINGIVSDPDNNNVLLEVEIRPVGTAFTNTPTCSSSHVTSGGTASATCSGLTSGQYHWQARASESLLGAKGPWVSAGGNSESSPDFVINSPPNKPSKPSGTNSGYTGITYSYSTASTDPDGNVIKYLFDWGDGTTTETAHYPSGSTASASHSWSNSGTYYVKVKATDGNGAQSVWSDSLPVSIQSLPDLSISSEDITFEKVG